MIVDVVTPDLVEKAEDIRRNLLLRTHLDAETAAPLVSMLLAMTRINDYVVIGTHVRPIDNDYLLPYGSPSYYQGSVPGAPLLCIRLADGPLQNLFWYLSPYRIPNLVNARINLGDAACRPTEYVLFKYPHQINTLALRHTRRPISAPAGALEIDRLEAATALALGVQARYPR